MKIIIISGSKVISHEIEIISYFIDKKNINLEFYSLGESKNKQYFDSFLKYKHINIYKSINFTSISFDIIIYYNYVISDENYEKINNNTKGIFIGNYTSLTGYNNYLNNKIKKLYVYNFFKSYKSLEILSKFFTKSEIINNKSINYPSGLKGVYDLLYRNKSKKYEFDIIIVLGSWTNFVFLDELFNDLKDLKIIILGIKA